MTTLPGWLGAATPVAFRDILLAGTIGRDHLLRAAGMAQRLAATAGPSQATPWRRRHMLLLAAALEEDSLFAPTAAALLTATTALPHEGKILAPAFVAQLEALTRQFVIPENTAYYQRLVQAGDTARLDRYLENECRTGRYRLFWLHVALHQALLRQHFAWAKERLKEAMPPELAPLGHKISGDLALLAGKPEQALGHYASAQSAMPWPAGLLRQGLAARQSGDPETAKTHLAGILVHLPEHVSAALALYDLAQGRHAATAPLPEKLAIALYTYNKASDIDVTLASLFASTLGEARVLVLDNASTDATPALLAAWAERIGSKRFSTIRLPVNIGAPAARNWLAADPRLREADAVCYLDDDVDLPPDWLGRLAAAAAFYPEAGVWGCHVADAQNPAIAQGIDAQLLPLAEDHPEAAQPHFSDAHARGFDYGGFAHMRPCLSVMGCCHLFRRDRLMAAGGFDIRYSPSQYDDVDHDLRLALSGRPPVYQGHLTVRHRRPAPVLAPPRPDQLAGGQANFQKLQAKHAGTWDTIATTMRGILETDLRQKWEAIRDLLATHDACNKNP